MSEASVDAPSIDHRKETVVVYIYIYISCGAVGDLDATPPKSRRLWAYFRRGRMQQRSVHACMHYFC